jgi:transposase
MPSKKDETLRQQIRELAQTLPAAEIAKRIGRSRARVYLILQQEQVDPQQWRQNLINSLDRKPP